MANAQNAQLGLRFLDAYIRKTPLGYVSSSLSKPYYVEGELVQGAVFCDFLAPVYAKSITVKIKGYEKVEWHAKDSRSETVPGSDPPRSTTIPQLKRKRAKKVILKQKIPVQLPAGNSMKPGQYTFPWTFQLPEQCPSTFYERQPLQASDIPHGCEFTEESGGLMSTLKGENVQFEDSDDESPNEKNKLLAVIRYKISVKVDLLNMPGIEDLYCRLPLMIHPKLKQDIQPAFQEATQDVIVCCCLNKGSCTIATRFDKTGYVMGETANVMADINNASTKELETKVMLRRNFKIKANCGKQDFTEDIITAKFPNLPPQTNEPNRPMPLQLTGEKVKPTTQGNFISCSYDYFVHCGVAWGKDIELKMPVVVYVPQPPPNALIPVYNPGPVVMGASSASIDLGFGLKSTVTTVGEAVVTLDSNGSTPFIGTGNLATANVTTDIHISTGPASPIHPGQVVPII